jgi:predicted hotdog family 3-hydroxylacyl-ACP dehydratase
MRLDRAWLESRLPHQGRMCLLDEVIDWSQDRVRCRAASQRAADHPLRAFGRLGIACGIEYAAQTMAVHGVLAAEQARVTPRAGFLASVRGVRFDAARLDDVAGDLLCTAIRVAGDDATVVYEFSVQAPLGSLLEEPLRPLLAGRATITLHDFGTVTS